MTNFNASKPNDFVTGSKVTLECLDPGLLANKVGNKIDEKIFGNKDEVVKKSKMEVKNA